MKDMKYKLRLYTLLLVIFSSKDVFAEAFKGDVDGLFYGLFIIIAYITVSIWALIASIRYSMTTTNYKFKNAFVPSAITVVANVFLLVGTDFNKTFIIITLFYMLVLGLVVWKYKDEYDS